MVHQYKVFMVCTRSMIFFSDLMRAMEMNNVFEACKYLENTHKIAEDSSGLSTSFSIAQIIIFCCCLGLGKEREEGSASCAC